MKRRILCAAVVLFFALAAWAGSFGLEMGMTLEEVQAACGGRLLEHISDIRYYIKPEKTHPSFVEYIAWISPAEGLCYIRANGDYIKSNDTGDAIKNEFYKVEKALSKSYGKSRLTDKLSKESLFRDETYWMYTLGSGERKLEAQWFPNKSNIVWVYLTTSGTIFNTAMISVQYEFSNREKAEATQDDVL